jgi:hypothetical protein
MMFGHNSYDDQQGQNSQAASPPLPNTPTPAADGVLGFSKDSSTNQQQPPPTPPPYLAAPSEPMLPAGDADHPSQSDGSAADSSPESDELLALKQHALQQLSPLLNHLDQTPEEKFRTTMMMIQTTDNPDMIKTAYDAAQNITDDKVKAQALLDVINEINYFTQHPVA